MRSRTSTSTGNARFASRLVFAAMLLAPAARGLEAQVRPKVTLEVAIDTSLYRWRLGDSTCVARCHDVLAGLLEPTRAAFERYFGFLDWRSSPAQSPDTVRVTWTNGDTYDGYLRVAVRGRERDARTHPHLVVFEGLERINGYHKGAWQSADSIIRRWSGRLDTVLAQRSEAQAIVSQALSHVPFRPLVGLEAMPQATVHLTPSQLRANPDHSPIFLVRADVTDAAAARRDLTDVMLQGCGHSTDPRSYACTVQRLVYTQRTPAETLAVRDSIARLARRAQSRPVTLHIMEFERDPNGDIPIHRGP